MEWINDDEFERMWAMLKGPTERVVIGDWWTDPETGDLVEVDWTLNGTQRRNVGYYEDAGQDVRLAPGWNGSVLISPFLQIPLVTVTNIHILKHRTAYPAPVGLNRTKKDDNPS